MFAKEKWKRFLCDKKWFLLALIPAAALLWCCFLYIRMTQTPLKSLDISPASDPVSYTHLVCVIGVAPVKPAEFVIFRLTQKTGE